MEPDRQIEVQLGHMCNNRCVFCVSGQRTAMREAFPVEASPILEHIRKARSQGMRKLTLLGGEPTIQPEFMNILRYAVSLGFEEIVIFTNGVKTARESFIDEVLATGGNFTWRLSFQGATREAHERTTKKRGSFGRLVETMRTLHAKKQRLTVNMCVVSSNYESVEHFPGLLLPFDAVQLHLDMIRPLDAGIRTEEEMRAMLPRYSDMVPHLERMIAGFPAGFDVNIGNLPYCIAPGLAPWIHHDGETTMTVAIDQQDSVSEPWNKYEVKRRDKLKRESCRTCVFDAQCSGVFETYRDFYGMDELVPVTRERLAEVDPRRNLFTLHFEPVLEKLSSWSPPEPFGAPSRRVDSVRGEVFLSFPGPMGAVTVAFRRPEGGVASTDQFSLHLLEAPDSGPFTLRLLRSLFAQACEAAPGTVLHPVGEDAVFLGESRPRIGGLLDQRLGLWLRRLRAERPFGALRFRDVVLDRAGREAVLSFADAAGTEVKVTLSVTGRQLSGGYRLVDPSAVPSPELVSGLRMLIGALRAPAA